MNGNTGPEWRDSLDLITDKREHGPAEKTPVIISVRVPFAWLMMIYAKIREKLQ